MINWTDIKELTRDRLVAWLEARGIEAYRADQILKWVYVRQADAFDEMTDLGKGIRFRLSRHFTIDRLEKVRVETSKDGSVKTLFRLKDANAIESVLIPEKGHYTLCISTQVGCAQGCGFCLTAKGGLVRNLTAGEIIAQVRDAVRDIASSGGGSLPLTNIVLMGMGEPLANFRHVTQALDIITDSETGLQFSDRRITLSTVGLASRLPDLNRAARVNLAVSLNAADNRTRSRLMPINRVYPLETLIEACRKFQLKPRRRITFEYILIKGINDSPEDAERLGSLLRPVKAKINLIPFNEYQGSDFKRPDESAILLFQETLIRRHYTAVIRRSKGQDISAACGQLRVRSFREGNSGTD
jgi:23S rRNA (adenine2503-C2)-methyltransferase